MWREDTQPFCCLLPWLQPPAQVQRNHARTVDRPGWCLGRHVIFRTCDPRPIPHVIASDHMTRTHQSTAGYDDDKQNNGPARPPARAPQSAPPRARTRRFPRHPLLPPRRSYATPTSLGKPWPLAIGLKASEQGQRTSVFREAGQLAGVLGCFPFRIKDRDKEAVTGSEECTCFTKQMRWVPTGNKHAIARRTRQSTSTGFFDVFPLAYNGDYHPAVGTAINGVKLMYSGEQWCRYNSDAMVLPSDNSGTGS